MRIGLDGFPLTSPRTGVGHYTFELARAMALIAPDDQFELLAPAPFHGSVVEDLRLNCPPNLRLVNPNTIALGRRRWWAVGLPLYMKQVRLDLFHGTNYEVPLWNRSRNVITVHDLSIFTHPDTHDRRIARRARRRLPIMLRAAARIITPSEAVKREVCDRFKIDPNKVAVTPEAPRESFQPMRFGDTAEIRRRLAVEDEFILFVGTIEPRKNLLTLVRAFDDILQHTSLRLHQLVIAGGEGWLRHEFDSLISTSKSRHRLRITEFLDDEELRALYSSCRLFCLSVTLRRIRIASVGSDGLRRAGDRQSHSVVDGDTRKQCCLR